MILQERFSIHISKIVRAATCSCSFELLHDLHHLLSLVPLDHLLLSKHTEQESQMCYGTADKALLAFWFIWFINQRTLYNPEFSVIIFVVHTSPWHKFRHRNFIFSIHMHICPPYVHIKYLVILTCSF